MGRRRFGCGDGTHSGSSRAHGGLRAGRSLRSRHSRRRGARSQPDPARRARHRHPQCRDRSRRAGDPGGARHAGARRHGPARAAGPGRLPRPCPAGRRHRPVGRRAGALHRHHHLCERGRRRRRQLFRLQAFRHRPVAHAHPGLPAHLLDRPVGLSGRRDAQHRPCPGRRRRQDAGGESRRAAGHQGARDARRGGQQRARASEAGDRRRRTLGRRGRARDVPHRQCAGKSFGAARYRPDSDRREVHRHHRACAAR